VNPQRLEGRAPVRHGRRHGLVLLEARRAGHHRLRHGGVPAAAPGAGLVGGPRAGVSYNPRVCPNTPGNAFMSAFIRFSDLCSSGRAKDQRVFIRADLNVPMAPPELRSPPEGGSADLGRPGVDQDDQGRITEDTRIRASVPAIRLALDAGAAVMVTSHLGRPTEGAFKPEDSLQPVAARLAELLGQPVRLIADWVDGDFSVAPGEVVLLENCRLDVGEKKNSPELAKKLGALCDIFVHDAFGTAHRAEGTTYGIAETAPVACAGPLLAAEMDAIAKALANPKRPLVAIVAGS